MKFGHFDDAHREYVIDTPRTPLPWINYLGSEDFFSLVSNTGGGYSFYRDARLRRITRYRYNNSPLDMDGHRIYINDGGTIWNPGWQPTKTELDSYSCRHGLGYTILTGEKNGIRAQQELFVPRGDACEIDRLTLENKTDAPRTLDVFSYVEFCLWDAMDDSSNFQRNFSTGEVEVVGSAIYHKTEYRERRDHYAVFWANTPVTSFDTSRDAFCGVYGGPAEPEAVKAGHCSNSVAHGWAPVGAHHFHLTLEAGETKTILFGLGYIENPVAEKFTAPGVINKARAEAMMARYATDAQVDEARKALAAHWDDLLSALQLDSGDEKLDRMVNLWHQYQCMVTFNMSRSASYYESGIGRGMGFRDSCQDLLGFVHMIPERARSRILDIAATQFEDGSAYHQYQPLTKKGNRDVGTGFNDDPLWLIAGTAAYLRETGDYSILDESVAFDNDERRRHQGADPDGAPAPQLQLHLHPPGPPRPAPHRPRRLERLPEPELLLRASGRELPDHRPQRRPCGGERFHRRYVRQIRRGIRRPVRPPGPPGRSRRRPRRHCAGGTGRADRRLGRCMVPPRLRRLRQARRQQGMRRGPDLHRAAGHVRHGGHRQGDRSGGTGPQERGRAAGYQVRRGAAAARLHHLPPQPW